MPAPQGRWPRPGAPFRPLGPPADRLRAMVSSGLRAPSLCAVTATTAPTRPGPRLEPGGRAPSPAAWPSAACAISRRAGTGPCHGVGQGACAGHAGGRGRAGVCEY
jgi:hypothetical protein